MRTLLRATTCLSLVGVVACSSSNPEAEAWAGKWSRSGTDVETCDGASASTSVSGDVTVTLGASGNTFTLSSTCSLVWTVNATSSNSATLASGAPCSLPVVGGDVSATFTQGTATLSGSTIMMSFTGSDTNGCNVTQTATLTEVAVPPQGSR